MDISSSNKIRNISYILRIYILSLFVLNSYDVFGQSVYMHEAQEDVEMSDPLSFSSILYSIGLILVSFFCFWLALQLKNASIRRYKKLLRAFLITFFSIISIACITISIYYENKETKQFNNAIDNFSQICNKAETYVILSPITNLCVYKEIDVSDFDTPTNDLYKSSWARKIFGVNNNGNDGVCHCYMITHSPMMEVVFAREANRILGRENNPYLYHCFIRPDRIRYFTQYPNPSNDILRAFVHFRDSFIKDHYSNIIRDDSHCFSEIFTTMLRNDYYEIEAKNGGDELWSDCKVMFENDIVSERVYEYKTINYGDFEIMYCISRPGRFGIEEKPLITPEHKYHSSLLKYERDKVYYKVGKFSLLLLIPFACIFGYGYLGRKNKDFIIKK